MVTKVIRRAARTEAVAQVAELPSPVPTHWVNLRGEIIGEMRRLGADPSPTFKLWRYDGTVRR